MSFEFYNETNFKQTDLGPLPQEWDVKKFIEFIESESLGCNEIKRFLISGDVY